jgi:hypothetical protein
MGTHWNKNFLASQISIGLEPFQRTDIGMQPLAHYFRNFTLHTQVWLEVKDKEKKVRNDNIQKILS